VKNFYADDDDGASESSTSSQSPSRYRDTLISALSDEWELKTLEEEKHTPANRDGVIFDGGIAHENTDALIQLAPATIDSETDGYDANRVLVQDNQTDQAYYVALSLSDTDGNYPEEGVSDVVAGDAVNHQALREAASFIPYEAVHSNTGSDDVETRSAFWNPDLVVAAVLAGATEVTSNRTTQTGISSFGAIASPSNS